jgi:sec-independent protein translocase protein TatC
VAAGHIQPFQQHVQELRQRIIAVVVVLSVGAGVGYKFHTELIRWLSAPLNQERLYYTSPSGGLQFTIQVCLLAGALLALPVAVYGIVRFVQPAVIQYASSLSITRMRTLRFIFFSYILAIAGASLAYWLVLPTAFHFFAGFNSSEVQSFITADKYFSFVVKCIAVFAAVFQLPLILLFINRVRPIKPTTLRKQRRWVILGSFLLALLMPFAYDPVTQVMLAAPVIFLYELSILFIIIANRKLIAGPELVYSSIPDDLSEFDLESTSDPLIKPLSKPTLAISIAKPKPQAARHLGGRHNADWQFINTTRPAASSRRAYQKTTIVQDVIPPSSLRPLRALDQSSQ